MTSKNLFVFGAVLTGILGEGINLLLGNTSVDIQLHDTMFVIAYQFIIIAMILLLLGFAFIYYIYPCLTKRNINETLGKIHFYSTLAGLYAIFFPLRFIEGLTRRYYNYSNFNTFNNFNYIAAFMGVVVIIVLLAQLVFVFNVVYSFFKGDRMG